MISFAYVPIHRFSGRQLVNSYGKGLDSNLNISYQRHTNMYAWKKELFDRWFMQSFDQLTVTDDQFIIDQSFSSYKFDLIGVEEMHEWFKPWTRKDDAHHILVVIWTIKSLLLLLLLLLLFQKQPKPNLHKNNEGTLLNGLPLIYQSFREQWTMISQYERDRTHPCLRYRLILARILLQFICIT